MAQTHRNQSLDGLRGIALLIVLFAHTKPQVFPGGNIGVDLFFVLSGFLITSILLAEHGKTGYISVGNFYARRALRLLPALLLVVSGVIIYTWLVQPTRLAMTLDNAKWVIFYFWNWKLAFNYEAGTWLHQWGFSHLWSLSVEEQFYIIWPFVLIVALPKPRLLMGTLIVGICAPAICRILVWESGPSLHLYFRTDLRFDNLMWGAATAWLFFKQRSVRVPPAVGWGSLIVFLVLARFNLLSNGFLYLGGYTLIGILASLIIGAAANPGSNWFKSALRFEPLRWTGEISYGLYLWHVPMFLACHRLPFDDLTRNLIAIAATYAIASLSYYGVERYFLRLKDRFPTTQPARPIELSGLPI
ncbi:acyltransferase family protein [Mesorhizobium sp. ZC-5]|uniref:acyltransferase family protein n=1 Tax=Mesorhizobium sp. ZC-5 TaxID=2986066 RepID=UPI0021E9A506|nr:acyltransferase [Mesorhizobium sp. ZC-5]MCV3240635.1 acyltransferase [Mesorhizobium sp. ZC-5]